jgi:hypothetical protein
MEKLEIQKNKKELTDEEWDLMMKVSGEFLPADRQKLIQWVLDLLNEKGKNVVKTKLKMDEKWHERVAFIGYVYQKSKEEKEELFKVFRKLTDENRFIGLGSGHDIFAGIDFFAGMIEVENKAGKEIYFNNPPNF